MNCGGGKTEEGFRKICEAASWVLGGIKMDYYCAVDMKAMEVIGDTIGGVDFVLETRAGKYPKGRQHLDGEGIVAYLRARRSAQVNANDIGRTARQRDLMAAIFDKIRSDPSLIPKLLLKSRELENRLFTNMELVDLMRFAKAALALDGSQVGSHVITGKYRTALRGWNFTFTDQDHRREVIRQVYGVQVPELPYVSFAYTKWLVDHGFAMVRQLALGQRLGQEVAALGAETLGHQALTPDQQEALAAFDLDYEQARQAFRTAADSMAGADTKAMAAAGKEMRRQGDALCGLFQGLSRPSWNGGKYWYADRLINEIDVNFR